MKPEQQWKVFFITLAFVLVSFIVIGLFWLATNPAMTVGAALAYAAGLSMIFLPCTLPLVFIIVPLSMGKGYKKGLIMALLFGLGLTITLTFYGISVGFLGGYFGMDRITRGMFFVAGIAAYIFGLHELKLIHITLPDIGIPQGVLQKGMYAKSFLMGLLLGNAGVGCPNPAFYVMLAFIATTGSISYGGWLGFVHGLGRATPLILIAVLAILGINATGWITKKKDSISTLMGWGLIAVGVYILVVGLFGMFWWEMSFLHQGWNVIAEQIHSKLAETTSAAEFFNIEMRPSPLERYWSTVPWWTMAWFLAIPVVWRRWKHAA